MDKKEKYRLIKDDYAAVADWYQKTYDATREMNDELKDFTADLKPRQTVLDAGCGPGKESIFMSENFVVTALDISPEMLEFVKNANPNIKTILGDLNKLEFEESSFDGIWTCRTIIHIPVEDLDNVFGEFARVLKKGGTLGMVTLSPTQNVDHEEQFLPEEEGSDPTGKLVYYRNLYSTQLLTQKLETAGFKIITSHVKSDADSEPFVYIKAVKQ